VKRQHRTIFLLITCCLLSIAAASDAEIARLRQLMEWKAGQTLADVGAGAGEIGTAAAGAVGPNGKVYLTELDENKRKALEGRVRDDGLKNVEVVQGNEKRTNLPEGCCDGIFLRRVYHHFTAPVEMDASLFRTVKPGGRVAVIDFPPRKWLTESEPVKGVPANRGGHGIPEKILVEEMTAAGFEVEKKVEDWPEDSYCVVFRRPAER